MQMVLTRTFEGTQMLTEGTVNTQQFFQHSVVD